jgi:hypothetical protein
MGRRKGEELVSGFVAADDEFYRKSRFMRVRMAGMSDWRSELLLSLYVWGAMVSLGVGLLMLRDTRRRFSLRRLFAFMTIVAIFYGSVASLFLHWLQSQAER